MLWESFLELLAPTRCAGCELPGQVLCTRCAAGSLIDVDAACPRCGAPFGVLVCTECWDRELPWSGGVALGELDAVLGRIVVLHKDGPERRLGPALGDLLGDLVAARWPAWVELVTWVPATRAARRRRGFDHAEGIARALAARVGVDAQHLLTACSTRDQRGLARLQRERNVEGAFRASHVKAGRIVLVDDVLTTGATLEAATNALLGAGASEVRVAVVARAW